MTTPSTSAGRSWSITRHLPGPPERVYRAWTEADQLTWFLAGSSARELESLWVDARVGGVFRLLMVQDGDTEYWTGGVYRELVPGARVAFSWGAPDGWPPIAPDAPDDGHSATDDGEPMGAEDAGHSATDDREPMGVDGAGRVRTDDRGPLVTVDLAAEDGNTRLTLRLELPAAAPDELAGQVLCQACRDGWGTTLDRLSRELTQQSGT